MPGDILLDTSYVGSRGISLQGSYTYSRSIENVVTPLNSYASNGMERALSGFDRAQILGLSYVYELRFFRGGNGVAKKVLGGWQLSGISRFESGTPFSVTGPIQLDHTLARWFSGSFALPALGTFGNLGRNVVRAPGLSNWDVSFSKKTELYRFSADHAVQLQFRAEFFNLFNHTQYAGVSAAVGAANFGQSTSARDPRLTQLGLRLLF